MTREQCIEDMARAMYGPSDFAPWETHPETTKSHYLDLAAAAYDAALPYIQAREDRVREMCADTAVGLSEHWKNLDKTAKFQACIGVAGSIRALDIGGQGDG